MSKVVLVHTGSSNVASMIAALTKMGIDVIREYDSEIIASAPFVVVPGVGTFGAVMNQLREQRIVEALKARIIQRRPTMLVCAGLQILGQHSQESNGAVGLSVVSVPVERFPMHLACPQQAWNLVEPQGHALKFVPRGYAFYANSYCMRSVPIGWNAAISHHGDVPFIAALQSGSVLALQFHPELSGNYGSAVMASWLHTTSAIPPSTGQSVKTPYVNRSLCRVIPCLDVKDGRVVKGVQFQNLTDAGDPASMVEDYQRQGADEIVILDVSATVEKRANAVDVIRKCRARCSLPITVGGGVRAVEDASALLHAGADKVAVNSAAVADPALLGVLSERFGAQCVVLSIDCKQKAPGKWVVMVHSGTQDTGLDVVDWAKQGVQLGVGEILLTSHDRDGTRKGFDVELIHAVSSAVTVPVVASGGADSAEHMVEAFRAGASAVLAASIFHFGHTTVATLKGLMHPHQVPLRPIEEGGATRKAAQPVRKRENIQSVIPCIDLMKGHAVQLVGGKPENLKIDAGDPLAVARKFRLAGEIAVVDLDAAISGGSEHNTEVIEKLLREASCRVGGGIRDVETAKRWLDKGARKVVIGSAATVEFLRQLPRDRVVVALDCFDGEVVIKGWKERTGVNVVTRMRDLKPWASHFLVTFVEREGRMEGFPLERVVEMVDVLQGECQLTIAGGVTTASDVAALDALGVEAQIGMAMYSGRLPLAEAMWASCVCDSHGLVPTVVCNERSQVLGLCYSSRESFSQAVSTQRGIYWSRSRSALWVKGETSGNTQELLAVAFDCDRDALKFVVKQQGPGGFCHRDSSYTCWGAQSGLTALQDVIFSRLNDSTVDPESYTARLFRDAALLAAKIKEEAGELVEAHEREHVANEVADVLYFALVKAAKHNVTLSHVERIFDLRALKVTRRPGHAKPAAGAAAVAATPAPPSVVAAAPATKVAVDGALFKRVSKDELRASSSGILKPAIDPQALADVGPILADVKSSGLEGMLRHARRLGDLPSDQSPVLYTPEDMHAAFDALPTAQQELLTRTAKRIRAFALHQKNSISSSRYSLPGGFAGQIVSPMQRAGIYAPGGRYPLPSSVLMGAVTARVAGVVSVVVASPNPARVILAACHVAGADALLAVGGAQAIAALAYGIPQLAPFAQPCDVVTGPGNKWVTAAKYSVSGACAIDMLAGPSECLVICDATAPVEFVAADLLAQAEHDVEARPILVAIGDSTVVDRVEAEMRKQLEVLPTRAVALEACRRNGVAITHISNAEEAGAVADIFAAEHVELFGTVAESLRYQLKHYGALFVGEMSAEVFGDYGAGPNHTLPTGGTARSFSGLSVHTFLRKSTFLELHPAGDEQLISDAVELGLMEGLHGHANAARLRLARVQAAQAIPKSLSLAQPFKVKLALPKGRMQDQLLELLAEAGMKVQLKGRELRPRIAGFEHFDIKLLKPRNLTEMLNHGTRQIGFVGTDLIAEMGASNVVPVFDTGLDPVRLVAAVPEQFLGPNNELPKRHLIIATEYESISSQWVAKKGIDAEVMPVSGSTEVFPPDDADMIIDNTATGATLEANRLRIVDVLAHSSTHLCVHHSVLDDPRLKKLVDDMILLLKGALEAKNKVVLEFNVPTDSLEKVCAFLPSMKRPTINKLYGEDGGWAVKVVVNRSEISSLLPLIKGNGGSDIIVSVLKTVLP